MVSDTHTTSRNMHCRGTCTIHVAYRMHMSNFADLDTSVVSGRYHVQYSSFIVHKIPLKKYIGTLMNNSWRILYYGEQYETNNKVVRPYPCQWCTGQVIIACWLHGGTTQLWGLLVWTITGTVLHVHVHTHTHARWSVYWPSTRLLELSLTCNIINVKLIVRRWNTMSCKHGYSKKGENWLWYTKSVERLAPPSHRICGIHWTNESRWKISCGIATWFSCR